MGTDTQALNTNLAMHLGDEGFKSEILHVHCEKLPFESFSDSISIV